MKREYFEVNTTTIVGGGFAGFNAVGSRGGVANGGRTPEAVEKYHRALAAAEAVFRASGHFPGYRAMKCVVRVDGGRAIVCMRRGRKGW